MFWTFLIFWKTFVQKSEGGSYSGGGLLFRTLRYVQKLIFLTFHAPQTHRKNVSVDITKYPPLSPFFAKSRGGGTLWYPLMVIFAIWIAYFREKILLQKSRRGQNPCRVGTFFKFRLKVFRAKILIFFPESFKNLLHFSEIYFEHPQTT